MTDVEKATLDLVTRYNAEQALYQQAEDAIIKLRCCEERQRFYKMLTFLMEEERGRL